MVAQSQPSIPFGAIHHIVKHQLRLGAGGFKDARYPSTLPHISVA